MLIKLGINYDYLSPLHCKPGVLAFIRTSFGGRLAPFAISRSVRFPVVVAKFVPINFPFGRGTVYLPSFDGVKLVVARVSTCLALKSTIICILK